VRTACIELTTRCPLRCVHCSAAASPEGETFLDAPLITSYLAARAPFAEVYVSGGEPFAHPNHLSVIKAARRVADDVVIYSSGTWTDDTGITAIPVPILLAAQDAGASRIDVSLYAASATAHEAVTGVPGSFNATVTCCMQMAEHGIPFGIHFVPVAVPDVLDVAQLSRELGAARLHVLAVAAQGRATRTSSTPTPELLNQLLRLLEIEIGLEIVLSSAIRQAIGLPRTPRDDLETTFVDARGFEYPKEGARSTATRSLHTIGHRR
jgi:MoaA/NifB/PqqE/SkfB family radical SAM enzyme